MLPLVERLALAASLICSLGAIECASPPAETTPAPAPAAEPQRPPEAPVHEAAAVAPQPDEQAPPASPTPASEPRTDPPSPAPESAPVEPDSVPAEPSRKLEVVAKLVEPKSTAGCGVLHVVVVMRYEIIQVLEGTYGERELYAAHSCPEMGTTRCRDLAGKAARRFKAGDVHHLRLDQRSRGGVLFDLFPDKRSPRYRVTCGNLVPIESP